MKNLTANTVRASRFDRRLLAAIIATGFVLYIAWFVVWWGQRTYNWQLLPPGVLPVLLAVGIYVAVLIFVFVYAEKQAGQSEAAMNRLVRFRTIFGSITVAVPFVATLFDINHLLGERYAQMGFSQNAIYGSGLLSAHRLAFELPFVVIWLGVFVLLLNRTRLVSRHSLIKLLVALVVAVPLTQLCLYIGFITSPSL